MCFAFGFALLQMSRYASSQTYNPPVLENFDFTSVSPGDMIKYNLTDLGKETKYPDFVQCDRSYGEGLRRDRCIAALETMPDGLDFKTYASQRKYIAQDIELTPKYYYDNKDDPSCVITVDLAGRSTVYNTVKIRKSTLRGLVANVNSSCIEINFGRGGFTTYHLAETGKGMANFKGTRDGGFDAPLFLTVQVSPRASRKRPGNTDPRINQRLQEYLSGKILPSKEFQYQKNKVKTIVGLLQKTALGMVVGGDRSWWDLAHIPNLIPENVDYSCNATLGRPDARNCEDASFEFIGQQGVVVNPRRGLAAQVGTSKPDLLHFPLPFSDHDISH